ncbi:MAG TPA: ATPase inhibitor subunit zeta [Stellaceae bacterium]|nr:ATPase inhibitor subunit zeta [Stellaceae bacterium]
MSIVRRLRVRAPQGLDGKFVAHRNKLLGLWAAERMGMMGETAVDYALGLVATEPSKTRNDAALVKKVCEDMSARGYPISEGDVSHQLAACASEARAQIPLDPES